MKRFSVLIVDDEPLARAGLRMLLAGDASGGDRGGEEWPRGGECDSRAPAGPGVPGCADARDGWVPSGGGTGRGTDAGGGVCDRARQYAIRAFEINALDYLLKPVTAERFRQSLERAKTRLNDAQPSGGDELGRRMAALLEAMTNPSSFAKRLAVRSGARTLFVPVDEIEWIQAAENYAELHTIERKPGARCYLLQATMNTLEASLDPERFLRIHRSLIVNIGRVKELQPAGHGEYVVLLRSGVRLESGRSYHEKLKALGSNPF